MNNGIHFKLKIMNKNMKIILALFAVMLWVSCEDEIVEMEDLDFVPFLVEDLNPKSSTYGEKIGPPFYLGKVSAYYFGDPG